MDTSTTATTTSNKAQGIWALFQEALRTEGERVLQVLRDAPVGVP